MSIKEIQAPSASDVYFDRGPVSLRNRDLYARGSRFVHQLVLGYEFSDIVPQLVIPAGPIPEGRYPVQKIDGPGWNEVFNYDDVPFDIHLEIAKESVRQLTYIFHTSGILIEDRHFSNIMLSESDAMAKIQFHGKYWRVWQVDLGWIYDSCKDSDTIGVDVRLPRNLRIKNKTQTHESIATVCRRMITNVLLARSISEKMESRLYGFYSFPFREQTFETLANFLDGLV